MGARAMIRNSKSLRCADVSMPAIAVALLACPMPLAAQAAPAPSSSGVESRAPSGSADVNDMEIVVTAQRREQSLSDVGLSITAIGGEALATRNFSDSSDLAGLVPGLSVSASGYSTPIYTLRGVGVNEQSAGSNSSVAVYVDEVPLIFPIMTQGTALDLQRVEVLKGPQGTLYGQNSTGGAINYIANKPTDDFRAGITGTFGRFDRGSLEGFVSGPISPTLKGRVAARFNTGGNWQRSLTRDDGIGKIKNAIGRAIIDWEPHDTVHISANLNGWIDKSDTVVPQLVKVFPSNAFNVDRNLVVVDTQNLATCSTRIPPLSGCPINANTGTRITANSQPVITRSTLLSNDARDADWDPDGSFDRDDKFWQGSVRLDWDLADKISLTSLTSYAHMRRNQTAEGDGTAISKNLINVQNAKISSFQTEVRLSADFSGIHWLTGFNYGHDRTNENTSQFQFNNSAAQNLFGFVITGGGLLNRQNIKSWAIFTNIDIPLNRFFTLSGGIRLSQDDRRFEGCGTANSDADGLAWLALLNSFRAGAGLAASTTPILAGQCYSFYTSAAGASKDTRGTPLFTPGFANQRLKENNAPWSVNLNFKPGENSLIYARVSRGFKAGNFSTLGLTDSAAYQPTVQEELTAYELGGRIRFGRLLRLEGAAFRYDYINKQLRARRFIGPPFGNVNAQDTIPESRLKGAELTAVLQPVEGLTISGSGTYIKSRITKYIGQTVDGVLQDQSGSPFNFTPKWSLNGDLYYTHPLNDNLNGFIGSNIAYRSKTSAVFNPPGAAAESAAALAPFVIKPYTLVDGQLGIESKAGKWKVFIWGKNIFNKYYWNNVVRVVDVIVKYPGQPATYGVTASFQL
jgi:iron complex outermembrane recepter protein